MQIILLSNLVSVGNGGIYIWAVQWPFSNKVYYYENEQWGHMNQEIDLRPFS